MEADIRTRELVVSSEKLRGKTLERVITDASPDMRHGLYLAAVSRGKKLAVEIVKLPFYKGGTARIGKSSG